MFDKLEEKMENRFSSHPLSGSKTGQYFTNEDGTVKVPAIMLTPELLDAIRTDLVTYRWNSSDFLLSTYFKNGTHYMWEVMTMLLNGSADNVKQSKEILMIDLTPMSKNKDVAPSPRVLNTHYRIDVLPPEFRQRKTVVVVRNPKDSCVSQFYHEKILMSKLNPVFASRANMAFADFAQEYMYSKDIPYGSYFDYTEYMWSLRNEPNILLVFYENLKLNPVEVIQSVNEFMGTNRSPELVQQIADATKFERMKKSKEEARVTKEMLELGETVKMEGDLQTSVGDLMLKLYRKGEVGDWKNHFTVAQNEEFDALLAAWKGGKDIPFIY
ncbi:sulfotransferase 1C2-like [Watersipora subatra]|uniref:sulfotransferase 1C2-like n=1 Tax=Watersipora subatra TaxID=2589382 RepID=UPI00355B2B68